MASPVTEELVSPGSAIKAGFNTETLYSAFLIITAVIVVVFFLVFGYWTLAWCKSAQARAAQIRKERKKHKQKGSQKRKKPGASRIVNLFWNPIGKDPGSSGEKKERLVSAKKKKKKKNRPKRGRDNESSGSDKEDSDEEKSRRSSRRKQTRTGAYMAKQKASPASLERAKESKQFAQKQVVTEGEDNNVTSEGKEGALMSTQDKPKEQPELKQDEKSTPVVSVDSPPTSENQNIVTKEAIT